MLFSYGRLEKGSDFFKKTFSDAEVLGTSPCFSRWGYQTELFGSGGVHYSIKASGAWSSKGVRTGTQDFGLQNVMQSSCYTRSGALGRRIALFVRAY